jgi:hypothetical protein
MSRPFDQSGLARHNGRSMDKALREHLRRLGAKGGKSRSTKKLAAVKRNLKKALAVRKRKAADR